MTAAALPVPAATTEIAGRSIALHYGDPLAEDRALHEEAGVVDRSARTRIALSGPKAAEMLTGLVTNDVRALTPGEGLYAAALTAKGKIVADVRILAVAPERLLVDAPVRAGAGLLAMVRKFINPRVAPWTDESAPLGALTVAGPRAVDVVGTVTGLASSALAALPPYAQLTAESNGETLTVARLPELAVPAFDLFVPADSISSLAARLAEVGARPCGLEAWEIARVEAGRPEWGLDIDENTIPQEANFDELHAISYTKGCYIGQETVARLHFRGHVNKLLRQLRIDGDALPPHGAALFDATGRPVGDARSVVRSPRFGALAIAMVRREVAPGDQVTVRWSDGEATATVAAMPYAAHASGTTSGATA